MHDTLLSLYNIKKLLETLVQNDKIVYRAYQKDDERQIVPLLIEVFDDWQILSNPMEYWKWKYKDCPTGPTYIVVAEYEGKIVGADHAIRIKIKEKQQEITGLYGLDGMTHADYRRRGINNGLRDYKINYMQKEKIQMNYAYTDNPILIKMHGKKHKIFPYKYKQTIRILNPKKHLAAKNTKNPHLKQLYYQLNNIIYKNPPKEKTKNLILKHIKAFDDRINNFWQEEAEKYEFIPLKNKQFLNWRYADPRAGEYTIIQAECENEIQGYIVLKIIERTKGYPEGFIIEISSKQDKEVISSLSASALEFLDPKVNAIRALTINNHPIDRVLTKFGFVDTRNNPHVYYYGPFNHILENQLNDLSPEKTNFSYGDLHLF